MFVLMYAIQAIQNMRGENYDIKVRYEQHRSDICTAS